MALGTTLVWLAATLMGTVMAYNTLGYMPLHTETTWMTAVCGFPSTNTPVSTYIEYGAATMSNVTVLPASSPTSCYRLPTPVSALTPMAVPINQALPTSNMLDPIFFYLGNNGTTPQYLGTLIDGSQALLDLSDEAARVGRLALTLSGGMSLVFDKSGIHLFELGCRSVTSVSIESFWAQIVNITSSPSPGVPSSRRWKREVPDETPFTVQVRVDKGTADLQPAVMFGQSPCQLQGTTPGTQFDIMVWNCQFPGANSPEKQCEGAFRAWLSNSPVDPTGVPGNLSDFLNTISPFLSQSGPAIAGLLPRELSNTISESLQWVGTTAQAVANEAVELGGLALCTVLHAGDEQDLTFRNGSAAAQTMGAFVHLPTPTLVIDLVNTPRPTPTQEPPRTQQPGLTSLPFFTQTTFSPIDWLTLRPLPGPINISTPAMRPTTAPPAPPAVSAPLTPVPELPPVGEPPMGQPPVTLSIPSATPVRAPLGSHTPSISLPSGALLDNRSSIDSQSSRTATETLQAPKPSPADTSRHIDQPAATAAAAMTGHA